MSFTEVMILDVGHGNSTILHGNNETVIIDCGAKGIGLLQLLEERKITDIKSVYLSHADQDHIGGLLTVLGSEEVKVAKVYLNSDGTKGTKLWDDLITILDFNSRNGKIDFEVSIHSELNQVSVGDIELSVIGPSKYLIGKGVGNTDRDDNKINSNSISASFLISYKSHPVVFISGDIDQISLKEIEYTKKSIMADVLIFPHHGGNIVGGDVVDFANHLLALVLPKTVIFSIGRRKFENPNPEVLKIVKSYGTRIACTQLSKHCSELLPKNKPLHLHSYFAKGRQFNECCGGTFVINLSDKIQEFPNYDDHQNFISTSVPKPLCR